MSTATAPLRTDDLKENLLKPEDAAKFLGIGLRTLWNLSSPRGPIPLIRVGKLRRFSPDHLRAYVESATSK